MNMQKALRKLYKAISGEDNYKVNISKLLIDIHYALTGKTPVNKNNHARIVSELADNWTGSGGGGSSDLTTAKVTFTVCQGSVFMPWVMSIEGMSASQGLVNNDGIYDTILCKGQCVAQVDVEKGHIINVISGNAQEIIPNETILIMGDCVLACTDPNG